MSFRTLLPKLKPLHLHLHHHFPSTNTTTFSILTRSYWREVLRSKPNPKNPSQIKFEDPSIMAMRSSRAQNAEGLLRRKSKFFRYEKPHMKRKKLKMARKYRSMERGVNDLKNYVKYIQEAKEVLHKWLEFNGLACFRINGCRATGWRDELGYMVEEECKYCWNMLYACTYTFI